MQFINTILSLGASVVLPIVLTVFGIVFGQSIGKSLRAGLKVGIAFIGINLVVGYFMGLLAPIASVIADKTGGSLHVLDVGWGALSSIAWGSSLVPLIFIFSILVNIVMLFLKATNTLNVDIWNFWGAFLAGQLCYIQTGSVVLGTLAGVLTMGVMLVLADLTRKRTYDYFQIPGISITHFSALSCLVIVWPFHWLLNKIPGINKINWSPEKIQQRLGIIGEPMFIGVIIGGGMALFAGLGWITALTAAIGTAATMILLPKMVGVLMEGLVPLSDGIRQFMSSKFKDRELSMGMDSAILVADPANIASSMLLIPITIFLAVVLPGNEVLPVADLVAIIYSLPLIIAFCRGNIFKTLILGIILMSANLYVATWTAPLMTQASTMIGYTLPTDSSTITSLAAGSGFIPMAFQALLSKLSLLF
jgi:PTS system galactitol-specific IIC component